MSAAYPLHGDEPLRTVWEALENSGHNPRGPLHQFVAQCPAHEDRFASLSIGTGIDERALVYCHAGCEVEHIIRALGLAMCDLFPAGHRHARPIPGVAEPVPMADLMLRALNALSIDYRATLGPESQWVAECCSICQRADKWPLWITEDERRRVALSCMNGCDQVAILRALAVIA
jgi:hypothetical protein